LKLCNGHITNPRCSSSLELIAFSYKCGKERGLVASYVALLLWIAHREEGILLMLLFRLEEIGSISEFKYEIASVLLFAMHLKEVLQAHTEV
jgi:hypothetical protein